MQTEKSGIARMVLVIYYTVLIYICRVICAILATCCIAGTLTDYLVRQQKNIESVTATNEPGKNVHHLGSKLS